MQIIIISTCGLKIKHVISIRKYFTIVFPWAVKKVKVACEQAPDESERSEGACRLSIDAAVL